MIGLALAIVRGHASQDVIESAWNMDRIDVPRAPGLGLMLDEVSVLKDGALRSLLTCLLTYSYRVTHQHESYILLTSKQKFPHSI